MNTETRGLADRLIVVGDYLVSAEQAVRCARSMVTQSAVIDDLLQVYVNPQMGFFIGPRATVQEAVILLQSLLSCVERAEATGPDDLDVTLDLLSASHTARTQLLFTLDALDWIIFPRRVDPWRARL